MGPLRPSRSSSKLTASLTRSRSRGATSKRRTVILLALLLLLLFTVYQLPQLRLWTGASLGTTEGGGGGGGHPAGWEDDDPFHPKHWTALGKPAEVFQTNLRDDVKYITCWLSSGWTNDLMSLLSLLYLSLLTQRLPILPPFVPSHLSPSAGYLPLSEIFDLPLLSHTLHTPIVEWGDLKSGESEVGEGVGCWSTWMGFAGGDGRGRGGWVTETFSLEVSYTPVPPETYDTPHAHDPHLSIPHLVRLSHPSARFSALLSLSPSPSARQALVLPPSDHMMCFDLLYYARLVPGREEWEEEYAPAWRAVGSHLRWSAGVREKAGEMLRAHWGVPRKEAVPPYISVHMRRGDFGAYCSFSPSSASSSSVAGGEHSCLPSLSQLQRRVRAVQHKLHLQGLDVPRVLVTSDEPSPAWWSAVHALGYTSINHTALLTAERWGEWYPSVLDAAFLSMGKGFVGTEGSTMSLLAKKRVEEWEGGVGEWVRWKGVAKEDL